MLDDKVSKFCFFTRCPKLQTKNLLKTEQLAYNDLRLGEEVASTKLAAG